jgi:pimeloyl-ACP methyl ester carboxylesterase
VPPAVAHGVKAVVRQAELVQVSGLGHLAHEEAPHRIANIVRRATRP